MSAERVVYTVDIKDLASAGFEKMTQRGKDAFNKLDFAVKKVDQEVYKASGSMNLLKERLSILENTKLHIDVSTGLKDIKLVNREIEATKQQLERLETVGTKKGSGGMMGELKSRFLPLGPLAIGTAVAAGAISFGKQILETTAKFENYKAVLSTALGSDFKANMEFASIKNFAAVTPFQVDELTGSFVKLTNQGYKPTMRDMRSMGDLSASVGKSFDQLTEAIIDAQTNEFERLKEFGVKASVHGDKVAFTFRGIKTDVDNSASSIRNYLLSLGNIEGISGSMVKISETLGGKISNLGDSWDNLLNTIGSDKTNSAFSTGLTGLTSLLNGVRWALASPLTKGLEGMAEEKDKIETNTESAIKKRVQGLVGLDNNEKYNRALNYEKESLLKQKEPLDKYLKQYENIKPKKEWGITAYNKYHESLRESYNVNTQLDYVNEKLKKFEKPTDKYDINSIDWYKAQVKSLTEQRDKLGKNKKTEILSIDTKIKDYEKNIDLLKGKKVKDDGLDSSLSTVKGDQRVTKNVTINVAKQIEGGVNIYSTTMEQGLTEFESNLRKVLFTIINDANVVAANG